jgi:hypothetical protein
MTRTDYELVAGVLRTQWETEDALHPLVDAVMNALARKLADAFQSANPRFDRTRFLAACGVEVDA